MKIQFIKHQIVVNIFLSSKFIEVFSFKFYIDEVNIDNY